jgi:ATP phosphoribosyltransferase regulatory subunit
VRADMTPQAARIDATPLMSELPTRLCYLGTVLHTRPDGFAGTRSPMQVGAELFGHAGIESDIEILSLALETLSLTGVRDVQVDLGHVGIFRALAREAGLGPDQETSLFDALQRKAVPEIGALLEHVAANGTHRERLARLAFLNGGAEVLDEARAVLEGAGTAVHDALDNLCAISAAIQARAAGIPLYFDLAELRGYNYQTGMVFAVYVPGYGQEIARGGRYDDIGRVFGRPRPATGFSTDLKTLIQIGSFPKDDGGRAIFAPSVYDPGLLACIRELRAAGEHVVCELPGQAGDAGAMGCARRLVEENGRWIVVPAGQGQGDG